jgi:glycosyltransferase involved in cell wall biosynthesis
LINFSIVTVVRNDLEGLKKTRRSLETQKYKNWTHIIIDGNSKEDTFNYLKALPEENTIFISEIDSGIYNAMNKVWKIADPESFVFYLNAHDVFTDSNSLTEAQKALNTNTNTNWGCTTHEEIEQNGDHWVCKLVSPPSIPNQLYAFGYRSHQAVIMKAKFIKLIGGFDESYKLAADWDLIVRALLAEKPVIWTHPLARFELGGFSSTRLLEAHMELRALRVKYLHMNRSKRILDDLWCSIYLDYFGFKNYLTPIVNFSNRFAHISNRSKKTIFKVLLPFLKIIKLHSLILFSRKKLCKNSTRFIILQNRKKSLEKDSLIAKLHRALAIFPYESRERL